MSVRWRSCGFRKQRRACASSAAWNSGNACPFKDHLPCIRMMAATHMRVKIQQERAQWRVVMRLVAIVFLLLACADLAFPDACEEDSQPLFAQSAGGPFAPADAPPAEDCFCCCSHILSAEFSSPLGQLALLSGSDQIASSLSPYPPAKLLYHPPRSA